MKDNRPNEMLDNQSEKIHYTFEDYPIYIHKDRLSDYPNYSGESHWHQDPEFVYIASGQMTYSVNGKQIVLPEGSGLLVNSSHLHFGYSREHSDCTFLCLIVNPILLSQNAYFEKRYVRPVLENPSLPYLVLSPHTEWQSEILDCIKHIYTLSQEGEPFLEIQQLLLKIWGNLFCNTVPEHTAPKIKNADLISVKTMVSFIHQNYTEKISLSQIAASGNVCKSKCCTLFKTYLSRTPGEYLNDYRLKKSLDDLVGTDKTVSEIASRSGINSTSYYSELFRKSFGCSPREYTRQNRGRNGDGEIHIGQK